MEIRKFILFTPELDWTSAVAIVVLSRMRLEAVAGHSRRGTFLHNHFPAMLRDEADHTLANQQIAAQSSL